MPEEITAEELCATWGGALAIFGEGIEKLAKKLVLTSEEKEEMKTLIKHAGIAVRAAEEECKVIIERK